MSINSTSGYILGLNLFLGSITTSFATFVDLNLANSPINVKIKLEKENV